MDWRVCVITAAYHWHSGGNRLLLGPRLGRQYYYHHIKYKHPEPPFKTTHQVQGIAKTIVCAIKLKHYCYFFYYLLLYIYYLVVLYCNQYKWIKRYYITNIYFFVLLLLSLITMHLYTLVFVTATIAIWIHMLYLYRSRQTNHLLKGEKENGVWQESIKDIYNYHHGIS